MAANSPSSSRRGVVPRREEDNIIITTTTTTNDDDDDDVDDNNNNVNMAVGRVPRYMQQFLAWLAAFATAQPYISVPSSVPSSNVSGAVDPNFAGFAFEQASLWNYAQDADGNPNVFSQNLMAAITNRTGGIPLIRLGGTSADYAYYNASQTAPALPRAEIDNYQDIGGTTIGPAYWALCQNFPDARYIIQTPMAIADLNETVLWATTAVAALGLDAIYALEPGNEPDLYPATGLGPPTYQGTQTNESYVGNFTAYAAALIDALALTDDQKTHFFQAFDTSAHFNGEDAYILDVPTVFGLGLDDDDNIVQTVAHHYYQTDCCGTAADLATGLMSHSAITAHLDLFRPAIAWLAAHKPGVAYVLSEIGNSLNPTHDYAYQAVLGAALWLVDLQLYALSLGVARFHLQQIMHSGFDLWLPQASAGVAPQVFASFYAQPLVADFVGNAAATAGTTTTTQVASVSVDDDPTGGNIAAYVAFVDGAPVRLAVVNFDYWNQSSSTTARTAANISVSVPANVTSVTVDKLSSPLGAGASADTMTYAGSQWTYESLGREVTGVRDDSETLAVAGDGVVYISVNQSSAVLVHLVV